MFILTPTAKKIITACDLARESRSPVILSGPSHIGKTWTLRHYAAQPRPGRTCLAELDAASGLRGLIRTLARACGIHEALSTAALRERIRDTLTPDTVLILDEMHLLAHTGRLPSFFASIEVIRRLYDQRPCGMVLCWTNLATLTNASQRELVQIWRRGVHKVACPLMPTKADLTAILRHHGLEFPDRQLAITLGALEENPYEIVRQQARDHGLKAITERLRYGRHLATKTGEPLSWTHFVDAHLRIEKQALPEPEWH